MWLSGLPDWEHFPHSRDVAIICLLGDKGEVKLAIHIHTCVLTVAVAAGIQDCLVSCHCLVFFFSYAEHEHHICPGSQAAHTDSHFISVVSVVSVVVGGVVVVVAFGLCQSLKIVCSICGPFGQSFLFLYP